MAQIVVAVDIEHGRLTPRQPHLLPETGVGLLTVLPDKEESGSGKRRVTLPLVHCEPGSLINPTAEELDDSLWD